MDKKSFSVCMSVYHGDNATFFKEAVDSLFTQTRQPDEIVLVVDGPVGDDIDQVISVFERQHDHRVNPLHRLIFSAALPDFLICKIPGGIFFCLFEERLDHIDGERLTKPAGPGKQRDHVMVIDQIPDQKSFVHIIALTGYFNI